MPGQGLGRAGRCREGSGSQTAVREPERKTGCSRKSLGWQAEVTGAYRECSRVVREGAAEDDRAVVEQRLGLQSLRKAGFGAEPQSQQLWVVGTQACF